MNETEIQTWTIKSQTGETVATGIKVIGEWLKLPHDVYVLARLNAIKTLIVIK